MKKLLSLALVAVAACAYDVTFNKSFSTSLEAELLGTSVSIEVTKKTIPEISKVLERYGNFFKSEKLGTLKNGSYSISPEYKYTNNESKFVGYRGNISYTLQTPNAKIMNELLDKLVDLNDSKSSSVKLRFSSIQWSVSEQSSEKALADLRLKSIKWGVQYAQNLSSDMQDKCKLKDVNIAPDNAYYPHPLRFNAALVKQSLSVTPLKSAQQIQLNASYKVKCK